MVFLADRGRYTQRTLLRDVHDRLAKQAGCGDVRYRPSRRRPRYVVATVDPTAFLGTPHDVEQARLESRFWYPEDLEYECYRINWIEPERNFLLGFHRDADHPELGPCHVQLEYDGTLVERRGAAFLDDHPLAVLDARLRELPSVLAAIRWKDDTPSLQS